MNHLKAQVLRLKGFIRSGDKFGVIYLDDVPALIKRNEVEHQPDTFTVTIKGEPIASEITSASLVEMVLALILQERRTSA